MRQKTYWLGLIAACGLIVAACSDDTTPTPKDGGAADKSLTDSTDKTDTAPPTPDVSADKGTALQCEKKCTDEASYLCVTDTKKNKCVECKEDGHCAANPSALGPKCDKGYCSCATNSDCSTNKNGKVCDQKNNLCSCTTDADCTGTDKCVGSLFGAKVCTQPCTKDADCSSKTPKCEKSTGRCVACLADTDCTDADTPHCNKTLGACAECDTAAHCTGSISGGACVDGTCSCDKDSDCGTTNWGTKCVTKKSIFGDYKECGCNATTDCTNNQNGPACYDKFHKCTCDDDTKCTTTGVDKCNFPYAEASYKHCQKPCTKNDDCKKIKDMNLCNTTSGKCSGCLSATDCKDATKPYCNAIVLICTECQTDTDCKDADKPFCSPEGSCAECKADTDCSTSRSGSKCVQGSCACDTDADCKPNAWGNKCVTGNSGKSCGCSAAQECTNNENGSLCDSSYGICTCKSDTDCKVASTNKCGKIFAGAPITSCQKPCTKNEDCKKDTSLGLCETATSLCIGCKANTDCTYNVFEKTCSTTSKECVECLTTADCKANPTAFGPTCDPKNNYCVCANAGECANNPNGHQCDSQTGACSCTKDTDCPSGKTCTGNFAGVPICK